MRSLLSLALLFSLPLCGADVSVPVWAPDGQEIGRKQLTASVGGQSVDVKGVQGPDSPLILLLVIDLVDDLNRIDAARETLADLIDDLDGNVYVSLLQAQDGLTAVLDPTANRRKLTQELLALSVSGFPGLLDSVDQAAAIADRMLQRSDVRVAVLFVTDGAIEDYRGDYVSTVVNPSDSGDLSRRFGAGIIQEKMQTLEAGLARYAAPLFFVHLSERQNEQDVAYQNGLVQFAEVTGGQALFARSVADVSLLIRRALDRIEAMQAVTLELPDGYNGPTELVLTGEGGATLQHRPNVPLPEASNSKKGKKRKKR